MVPAHRWIHADESGGSCTSSTCRVQRVHGMPLVATTPSSIVALAWKRRSRRSTSTADTFELEREFIDAGHRPRRRDRRRSTERTSTSEATPPPSRSRLVLALIAGTVALLERGDALDASRTAEIEALIGRIQASVDAAWRRSVARRRGLPAGRHAVTRSALFGTFTDDAGSSTPVASRATEARAAS